MIEVIMSSTMSTLWNLSVQVLRYFLVFFSSCFQILLPECLLYNRQFTSSKSLIQFWIIIFLSKYLIFHHDLTGATSCSCLHLITGVLLSHLYRFHMKSQYFFFFFILLSYWSRSPSILISLHSLPMSKNLL